MRVANGKPIVLKELLRRFTEYALHESSSDLDVDQKCEDYVKVANIIALYFFCLGFAESRKVENRIWAYETMPTLGSVAASHVFPYSIPRVLRWKFGTPSEFDFGYIFGPKFVYHEMIVSANEAEQGYFMSTQTDEIFGVRFLRVDNPLHPRHFFGDSGEFMEFYNQLQPHKDNAQL
ncbi:hypothetical protein C2S52_008746, partial [Perilla frutescens var. hirtella]